MLRTAWKVMHVKVPTGEVHQKDRHSSGRCTHSNVHQVEPVWNMERYLIRWTFRALAGDCHSKSTIAIISVSITPSLFYMNGVTLSSICKRSRKRAITVIFERDLSLSQLPRSQPIESGFHKRFQWNWFSHEMKLVYNTIIMYTTMYYSERIPF